MIVRALSGHLRRQDWTAIAIELAIVVLGVFLAIQAANWNDARVRRQDARELLQQLKPELHAIAEFGENARQYYAITEANADRAFKGWSNDPEISDKAFVISAYQASQVRGFGTNGQNWALIFGAERIKDIDDPDIRQTLIQLMVFNYDNLELAALNTRYREQVRRAIPNNLQQAIRRECGDRRPPGRTELNILPAECDLELPGDEVSQTATALRARQDLPEDLRWHQSVIATFLFNARTLELHAAKLARLLDQPGR